MPVLSGGRSRPRGRRAALSESLAVQRGATELGRGAAIGALERRREVAVAGEAQFESQGRQVVIFGHEIERAREPQVELVTIERRPLDLLENLREIDSGPADFRSDIGEGPASRQVTAEKQLYAIDEPLTRYAVR